MTLLRKKHPEYKLLAELLDMAYDEFSNHGCNDFDLDDTPENRELIRQAELWNSNGTLEEDWLQIYKGKILTQDWFLMKYFSHLFDEMAKGEE